MAGSTFGTLFRITTFGESHGRAIGVVIDGVPPFLELNEADVQGELNRRRPGQSAVSTPREESDTVEIVSGVFAGRTMGPPVAMLIRNRDQRPGSYVDIKHMFRPGHADFTYLAKYGIRDWRGSGRASGRETACRVAAGAVAKKFLASRGVRVLGFAREIGGVVGQTVDYGVIESNIARAADLAAADGMIARIKAAQKAEDSVGGVIEIRVHGCPAGLGDPVFDKLTARLAQAVFSVGAVKGVEIGDGFAAKDMLGSDYNDSFYNDRGTIHTRSNHCGGILGGISTGEEIILRAAIRPPASISREQDTINVEGAEETISVQGRHDPCIVPRAVPVIEAMVAIALADALLIQDAYQRCRPPAEIANAFLRKEWDGSTGNG